MTTTAPITLSGTYTVDPDHSSFAFAVRHMGVSVFRGAFEQVAADLRVQDGALVLDGAAAVESISVRRPQALRDHLLGPDFFDAERHPEVMFHAGDVALDASGAARVEGELTMRGITRAIVATGTWQPEVEDPFGGVRAAIELSATLDRREYGMTWNAALPKGGDALGNEVTLTAHLELLRAEA